MCCLAAFFTFLFGVPDGHDYTLFMVYFGVYIMCSYSLYKEGPKSVGIACCAFSLYYLVYSLDSLAYGVNGLIEAEVETWIYNYHEIFTVILHAIVMLTLSQKYNSLVGVACYNIRRVFINLPYIQPLLDSEKRKAGKEAQK